MKYEDRISLWIEYYMDTEIFSNGKCSEKGFEKWKKSKNYEHHIEISGIASDRMKEIADNKNEKLAKIRLENPKDLEEYQSYKRHDLFKILLAVLMYEKPISDALLDIEELYNYKHKKQSGK